MNQLNYGLPREPRVQVPGLHALLRKREETGRRPRKDVRRKGNNWTREMDALVDGEGDGA